MVCDVYIKAAAPCVSGIWFDRGDVLQRNASVLLSSVFLALLACAAVRPALAQQVPQDPVMRHSHQQLQAQAPHFNAPVVGAPQVTRPQVVAANTAPPLYSSQQQGGTRAPLWGYISELRFGVLSHDVRFPSRHKMHAPDPFTNRYEGGINLNPEVVFTSPDFLDIIYAPRPHLGATLNSAGDTSSLYGGLGWDARWENGTFIEGFWGLAVHNGSLREGNTTSIEFGSPVVFRLGEEGGWRWADTHGISFIWEHMSHADKYSSKNQGIDSLGLRYSYTYD